MSVETVLAARDLTAGYGKLLVVRDVSLELGRGEVVALLGPNGAGKTTTLLALAGEIPVASGSVHWLGAPAEGALDARARAGLGFVPEERSMIVSMSVKDNLLLGRGGVDAALGIFPELKPLLSRRAGLLSGGEQQMLTLARALAREPKVLLADELSLGLGPQIVDRLIDAIRAAAERTGLAVLLVEQQARRAIEASDRWYMMRRGRIVAQGDRSDGLASVETAYLADDVLDRAEDLDGGRP